MTILETRAVAPFFLALLVGGCPKRQTVPRVVYVQPPASVESNQQSGTGTLPKAAAASQASAAAGSTEALVIEEPPPSPPPEPPLTAPVASPATPPAPVPRRRPRPRADSHDTEEQAEPADSAAPATPGEVPSLEPQSDTGQDEGKQLQAREDEIKRRITELEKNSDLSTTEQRTLTDATSFWSQSVAALRDHDLLRARELAQKASVLLAALEKR